MVSMTPRLVIRKDLAQKNNLTKEDYFKPGPFAGEGDLASKGPSRNFPRTERDAVNKEGDALGCHTCGSLTSGSKSEDWTPDHQPANSRNPMGVRKGLTRTAKLAVIDKVVFLLGDKCENFLKFRVVVHTRWAIRFVREYTQLSMVWRNK